MAITYKNYQDRIQLLNGNLEGVKLRSTNTPAPKSDGSPGTIFHPAVKNNWGIRDRIRGCAGQYITVYDSAQFRDHVGGQLQINYGTYAQDMRANPSLLLGSIGGADDAQVGRLRYQLQHIVLDYTITPHSAGWYGDCLNTTCQISKWSTISLRVNVENWQSVRDKAPENWFEVNPQGSVSSLGVMRAMNFVGFNSSPWQATSGESYYGLGYGLFEGMPDYGGRTQDHTSIFYGPPRDLKMREKSGMLFDISPTYNFYVRTSEPYEEVIANPSIPEYLLSNVYYLQHELANTSSTLLAPWHLDALSLGDSLGGTRSPIPYFVTDGQTVTEANTREYYHMYTDGLLDLAPSTSNLEGVKNLLETKNKNLAVLHSDLGALRKDAIQVSTLPFYNTIAIGSWQDQITGYASNRSILNALYDQESTRDFVDILQYMAMSSLGSSGVVTGSFSMGLKYPEKSTKTVNGKNLALFEEYDAAVEVLFDLGGLCHWLKDNSAEVAGYINMTEPNSLDQTIFESNPVKRIRDYSQEKEDALTVNPQSIPNAIARLFESTPEGDLASVGGVTRPMTEVYNNTRCHTETLLYIIEKRQVRRVDDSITHGPVVQTFYISPRLHSSLPLYYYDSQVKYNQEYTYSVKKVVLVFGNEYSYANPSFPGPTQNQLLTNPGATYSTDTLGMDAVIKNYASVKAVVVDHVLGGLAAPPIIDKPPVEPEISFYAYKGVNNKLLLLLNAGMGRNPEVPVEILETDRAYFEEEYYSQNGEHKSFEDIRQDGDKLIFKSDDPVDRYQLFRMDKAPTSYQSFSEALRPEVDPAFGIGGDIIDHIVPNKKYYYCARAIDVHQNVSNPTHIFEIEMVDNNGQVFLKQKIFNFEKVQQNYVKSGRRFIYIEPALQQVVFDPTGYGSTLGAPSLTSEPPTNLLGAEGVADRVWDKGFKVRLTSKKTGRKMDLNINFTNTGKVKPSE